MGYRRLTRLLPFAPPARQVHVQEREILRFEQVHPNQASITRVHITLARLTW